MFFMTGIQFIQKYYQITKKQAKGKGGPYVFRFINLPVNV